MRQVEFIQDIHVYLVDGKIVPSVSQILRDTIFKDKYANIPEHILKRAAQYGTNVHRAIELDEWLGLSDEEYIAYENYKKLVRTHNISPISHEQIVAYEDLYAGTYDMEAWVGSDNCLVDVKTTYKIDHEYLSWQLSLYELASGKRYDKFYVIWITKRGDSKLVEIERKPKQDLLKLLEVYYETRSEAN